MSSFVVLITTFYIMEFISGQEADQIEIPDNYFLI